MKKTDNTWIIIPGYNENQRIGHTIKDVKKYSSNIIVVDDGSLDNTFEIAKQEKVIVLKQIVNLGKGAAVKTGCDYAIKYKNAKQLILIDSDGQHDPKEIHKFKKGLEKNSIVFGYRKFSKKMPTILRFGNNAINFFVYMLYGLRLKDTQCGYRGLTTKAYNLVRWKSNDYAMESEMIANAGKYKLKYCEVPIKTIYHDKYKGTNVFDGIKIVFNMIFWRLIK